MGHEEARDIGETGADVFAEGLQFRMLLFGDLESSIEDRLATFRAVWRLVGETPVADEEFQLLERNVSRVLQSKTTVLGEKLHKDSCSMSSKVEIINEKL